MILAMSSNTAYLGTNRTNPFHYQKLKLNEIIVYRNSLPIAGTPVSTTDNKRIYYNTLEALDFVFNNSHGVKLANYHNHYIMAFDFTSTQEASHDFIQPELTNCIISVELKFNALLGENVELLFMGERASTVYVRSDRKIAKNLAFRTILKRDNTFVIVNASNSDQPGSHWLVFAQAGGQIFFADPLGHGLHNYPHVYKYMRYSIHEGNQILMNKPIQSANSVLCRLYCIYVAHFMLSLNFL